MFEKIKLALSTLHQGQAIVAAAKVKNWTMVGNGIAAMASAVLIFLRATGHDIPLSDDDLVKIGAAIAVLLGLLNPVSAIVTSTKIGLPAVDPKFPAIDSDAVITARVSAAIAQPDEVRPVAAPAPTLRAVPTWFAKPVERDDDHSGG